MNGSIVIASWAHGMCATSAVALRGRKGLARRIMALARVVLNVQSKAVEGIPQTFLVFTLFQHMVTATEPTGIGHEKRKLRSLKRTD